MQRHLASFETLDAHARTRGLALAAAAGLLALARTDAAADAHTLLARAGVVGDIAELHRPSPCFLRMISAENRYPPFGITRSVLLLVDDADEMVNLLDHPANRRGVRQLADAA